MKNTYGVLGNRGEHVDVSSSEKGAKRYASLNGYDKVTVRHGGGYTTEVIAIKQGKRWKKVKG